MNFENIPNVKVSSTGRFYQKGKPVSDDLKMEVALYLEFNESIAEIKRLTKLNRKTIIKIKNQIENNENIFEKKEKEELTGEHSNEERCYFLMNLLLNYPCSDLFSMKEYYDFAFDSDISVSMIYFILKKHLNFVYKKIQPLEWARTRETIRRLHQR